MKIKYILSLIILVLISWCVYADDNNSSAYPMAVSIASSGDYVLTSDYDNKVILWNIDRHNKTIIANNANFNSAYFIKNSNVFIWQDQNQQVYLQDVTGKTLKTFSNFVVYGQVMANDLKTYFAADNKRNLYSGYAKEQKVIAKRSEKSSFWNVEKIPPLLLTNDNKYLLSCLPDDGYINSVFKGWNGTKLGSVVLWSVNKNQPLFKYSGNKDKTYVAISPDDKFIVSGDEGGRILVWNLATGKLVSKTKFINENTKDAPDDLKNADLGYQILAIKFIDKDGHYLVFPQFYPYAILYAINSKNPIKYFNLGDNPAPKLDDYVIQNIDTAPKANILVIGRQDAEGIIVYKFDAKNLTLKKEWVGD